MLEILQNDKKANVSNAKLHIQDTEDHKFHIFQSYFLHNTHIFYHDEVERSSDLA